MSNLIDYNNNSMKRSKKPKPLFGIFRKNKPDPVVVPSTSSPIINYKNDPYSPPRIPKTDPRNALLSPQLNNNQRRPRSKSVGTSYNSRLMEERESALNKLCQKEINSPTCSLVDSLPLLSPTYTPPPVPPIPLRHQQSNLSPRSPIQPQRPPTMRKFSSAHDLRKAAKLQQDSIAQAQIKPLPTRKKDLSRSKSLNNGPKQQQQQQQVIMPITPNVMNLSKPRWPPIKSDRDDDDDDDIPLGYLQSPKSKPSSLLSDNEEEDDKDLIPIATLNIVESIDSTTDYQTAADKYKEKVKERLQLDNSDDDDNIPLLSLCK